MDEYLKDLNGSAAAIRAGYKGKLPHVAASRLMIRKPAIKEEIARRMAERSEQAKIDAAFVLRYAADMLMADIADIIDDEGSFKPVSQWPVVWRRMLHTSDVREIYSPDGKNIGRVIKAKFIDRLRALELVGRHIDVRAFVDRHEFTGADGAPLLDPALHVLTDEQLMTMRTWIESARRIADAAMERAAADVRSEGAIDATVVRSLNEAGSGGDGDDESGAGSDSGATDTGS